MNSKGHTKLIEIAEKFYDQFIEGNVPSMELPTRNKSNIVYDENLKVCVYGEKNTTRIANNIGFPGLNTKFLNGRILSAFINITLIVFLKT